MFRLHLPSICLCPHATAASPPCISYSIELRSTPAISTTARSLHAQLETGRTSCQQLPSNHTHTLTWWVWLSPQHFSVSAAPRPHILIILHHDVLLRTSNYQTFIDYWRFLSAEERVCNSRRMVALATVISDGLLSTVRGIWMLNSGATTIKVRGTLLTVCFRITDYSWIWYDSKRELEVTPVLKSFREAHKTGGRGGDRAPFARR